MNSENQLKVRLSSGIQIEFRPGRIDSWCVFQINPDGTEKIPLDIELFEEIKKLGSIFGYVRVYSEIFEIFRLSGKGITRSVVQRIVDLSKGYDAVHSDAVKLLYVKVYYAFVAEENRAYTVLGKRVKMLGIHQILKENLSPEIAANCSKGMRGEEIKKLCSERGF